MNAVREKGRGRISNIRLLPDECSEVVAWAAKELANDNMTQVDIYAEFSRELEIIKTTHDLDFTIPSSSAFSRHSMRLAAMTMRMQLTRDIAASINDHFDAETSDDLTLMAAEAIKTLVFELLQAGGEAGITPKGAMELANALRSATAAQSVSSERRRKIETEFAAKAEKAIDKVAKVKGLTKGTVDGIKAEILGIK